MPNARPRWTDTIGLCPSYGQLWMVYATESPKFLATCEYHPLLKDWSEVELTFSFPDILDRNFAWDRIHKGSPGMVVLAPGPVGYAVHRTLFSFSGMTITKSPHPLATFEEGPLIYKATATPDFQDATAKAWATVWRERIRRWVKQKRWRLARAFRRNQ
jgi:hypothetical protein